MSSDRRTRAPSSVGELLRGSALARGSGVDRDTWVRTVGERVANRTEPGPLQGGVLSVRVASSVWAQELTFLSALIVDRLKARGLPVKSLRFHVAKIEPRESLPARRTTATKAVELPSDLVERLLRIEDADLRAAVAEAAAYSLGRRRTTTARSRSLRGPAAAERETAPKDQTKHLPPKGPQGSGGTR
jgi:hypothetical protein